MSIHAGHGRLVRSVGWPLLVAALVSGVGIVTACATGGSTASVQSADAASGVVRTDFRGYDGATAVVIQRDGKLVVAGSSRRGGYDRPADFVLARYTRDGRLDQRFGSGGKLRTDFGGDDVLAGVAVRRDGKLVVTGTRFATRAEIRAGRGNLDDFVLARYTARGRLDPRFGKGGKVRTDFSRMPELISAGGGKSLDSCRALAIQRDGKIVTAGMSESSERSEGAAPLSAFARYRADGSLDPRFGRGGRVMIATESGSRTGASECARNSGRRQDRRGRSGLVRRRLHPCTPEAEWTGGYRFWDARRRPGRLRVESRRRRPGGGAAG